jgi:hypothetical protein
MLRSGASPEYSCFGSFWAIVLIVGDVILLPRTSTSTERSGRSRSRGGRKPLAGRPCYAAVNEPPHDESAGALGVTDNKPALPSMNHHMMKALVLLGLLTTSPAWAQGKLGKPADCTPIVQELKAKPPASGNKARAEALWDRFIEECRAKMGGPGVLFDAEEMMAIAQMLNLGRNLLNELVVGCRQTP